jgi:hypothetical protein
MAVGFIVKRNRPVYGANFFAEVRSVASRLLGGPVRVEVDPPDAELEPDIGSARLTVAGEDVAVDVYAFDVPDIGAGDEREEAGAQVAFEVSFRSSFSFAIALAAAIAYATLTDSKVRDEWGFVTKGQPAEPEKLLESLSTSDKRNPMKAAEELAQQLGVSFG